MLKITLLYIALILAATIPYYKVLYWLFPDLSSDKKEIILVSKSAVLTLFSQLFIGLLGFAGPYIASQVLFFDSDVLFLISQALFLSAFIFNPFNAFTPNNYLPSFLLGFFAFACLHSLWLFPLLLIGLTLALNNLPTAYLLSCVFLFIQALVFDVTTLFLPLMSVALLVLVAYTSLPISNALAQNGHRFTDLIKNRI